MKKLDIVFHFEDSETGAIIVEKRKTPIVYSDEMIAAAKSIQAMELKAVALRGGDDQAAYLEAFNLLLKTKKPIEEMMEAAGIIVDRSSRTAIFKYLAEQ